MLALEAPHVRLLEVEGEDEDDEEIREGWDDEYEDALGSRPDLPEGLEGVLSDPAYRRVLAVFYACTEEDPHKRPSAKEVIEALNEK